MMNKCSSKMQSLYNLSIRFCTRSFFSPHSRCRTRSLWGDGDLEASGFPGAGSRGCQQCSAMLCPFAVRVGKWKWDPVTKQKTGWKDPGGFSYSCSFVGCRFFMLFIIFFVLDLSVIEGQDKKSGWLRAWLAFERQRDLCP